VSRPDAAYSLTRDDLISVAKSSMSELTFYYVLASLDFEQASNWWLLAPGDDTYGNFVEILFCRLVKGLNSNHEQEVRLRRLFFEMIVVKNAKMTCSLNMLSLFLTQNQFTKQRLVEFYFPVLFYMASSFDLFHSELYKNRFDSLVAWLFNSTIRFEVFSESSLKLQATSPLSQENIEYMLFQYYSMSATAATVMAVDGEDTSRPDGDLAQHFKVNLSLKELSRNQFVKAYAKSQNVCEHRILNLVSEATRRFIFYFNDMKHLF
jgi:hypothetical protein